MTTDVNGASVTAPDPCFATLWRFREWWYVIEEHDCGVGHGWWLITHHSSRADALESAEARYPRPHQRV